jgi:hypothetical protein
LSDSFTGTLIWLSDTGNLSLSFVSTVTTLFFSTELTEVETESISAENLQAAFRKTGIYPYNP